MALAEDSCNDSLLDGILISLAGLTSGGASGSGNGGHTEFELIVSDWSAVFNYQWKVEIYNSLLE